MLCLSGFELYILVGCPCEYLPLWNVLGSDQPSHFFGFPLLQTFYELSEVQVLINPNNTAGITGIEVAKNICLQSEF